MSPVHEPEINKDKILDEEMKEVFD